MKKYVLGFLFDEDFSEVILVRKKTQDWQHNLLNGPGGKVEEGESSLEAMEREFEEETGLKINTWKFILYMGEPDIWNVDVFAAITNKDYLYKATSMDYEPIVIMPVKEVLSRIDIVENLSWIIPLCKDNPRYYIGN